MAQIFPLPKNFKPSSLSDYRLISIFHLFSKIPERLIYTLLSSFLSKNCLLNPLQSGIRPSHSTTTALLHITEDIRFNVKEGKSEILALVDFSNAFNNADFDILLGILHSLNISISS